MKALFTVLFLIILPLLTHAQRADFRNTDFHRADSIAALYPNHPIDNLYLLANKLTKSLPTPEEKFRAIYSWVCTNISNNYTLFSRNQRMRRKLKDTASLKEWNDKLMVDMYKDLVRNHSTICTGYAYLIRELSAHAGIKSVIIDGYGRTMQANIGGKGELNHSWNAVMLNDKWYLCDATWSSGAFDPAHNEFVKNYDDAYFLADPTLFAYNHYPADTTWMLMSDKPTLAAFLEGPITYMSIYKYQLHNLNHGTFNIMARRGENVSFRFMKNDAPLSKIKLIIGGAAPIAVYPEVQLDTEGYHVIEHTFKIRGSYTVHIILNGDAAVTYVVKVK